MPSSKPTIAILAGGPGSEREVSLKSGAQVLAHLPKEKYTVQFVEINREGVWLLHQENGTKVPIEPPMPTKKPSWDIVFIALHGTFGEDGRIQALLDLADVPYTSSGVLASALGMDKIKTKRLVASHGVVCPQFFELRQISAPDIVHERIIALVQYPCVVKPNASGSSVGVSIVKTKTDLAAAIEKATKEGSALLVEEYIQGREVTCGVMGNTGDDKLVPMPPVEIIADGTFFDYHAKYESAATKEICPAELSQELTKKVQDAAMIAHEALGCDGLTRSDFIIKDGVPYFLEINTIPGLTEQSLCPKEARAMGMSFGDLLERMVEMGLKINKRIKKPHMQCADAAVAGSLPNVRSG